MSEIVSIAREAHAGQLDKMGRDYFDAHLTPIAGGAKLFSEQAEAAAWLHDVLEDTDVTADQLLSLGVPPEVVAAVQSVTRRSTESYEQLIERSASHSVGKLVKLVDNTWNVLSNPSLAASEPEIATRMLNEQYLPARARLLRATGFTEESAVMRTLRKVLSSQLERLRYVKPSTLAVAAAVIVHADKVLACRRKPHKAAGGRWEFPGGKIEQGESASEALIREIDEELGVRIAPLRELCTDDTRVGDRVIRLTCILSRLENELPVQSTDHDRIEWVEPYRLKELEWADPDLPAVALLTHQHLPEVG